MTLRSGAYIAFTGCSFETSAEIRLSRPRLIEALQPIVQDAGAQA